MKIRVGKNRFSVVSVLALFLCVFLCFGVALTVPPVWAQDSLVVLSDCGYVNSAGSYCIVGELKNIGSVPLTNIEVTAVYHDSNGGPVESELGETRAEGGAELQVLMPGSVTPFKILYSDPKIVPLIDQYTLSSVSYGTGSALPEKLAILQSISSNVAGSLNVSGEIQNFGSSDATSVKVVGTFYDAGGQIVGEDYTFSSPANLASGATGSFVLLFSETERVSLVESYSLTAESPEYSLLVGGAPLPSPTPTPSPSPTPTPTLSPSPTAAPTSTPTPTAVPTPNPTLSPSPTVAPTLTPTPTAVPTSTPTHTSTPTQTTAPTPTLTPVATQTPKATASATVSSVLSPSPSSPSATTSPIESPLATPASAEGLSSEIIYAIAAVLGIAVVVVIVALFFKKRKNNA